MSRGVTSRVSSALTISPPGLPARPTLGVAGISKRLMPKRDQCHADLYCTTWIPGESGSSPRGNSRRLTLTLQRIGPHRTGAVQACTRRLTLIAVGIPFAVAIWYRWCVYAWATLENRVHRKPIVGASVQLIGRSQGSVPGSDQEWQLHLLAVFPMDGDSWDQEKHNVQDFPNPDHAGHVQMALTRIKAEERLHQISKNTSE